MIFETFSAKKFIGLKANLRGSANASNDSAVIPQLWQKLMPMVGDLKNRISTNRYALITGDLPFQKEEVAYYYALVEVENFDHVSAAFERFEISPTKATCYFHQGAPEKLGITAHQALAELARNTDLKNLMNIELFCYAAGYDRLDPKARFDCYLFLK